MTSLLSRQPATRPRVSELLDSASEGVPRTGADRPFFSDQSVAHSPLPKRAMFVLWLAVAAATLAGAPDRAWGWNAAAHKIVAEIAWLKLDPAERQAIAGILRRHPRFHDDFAAAFETGVAGDPDTENHWLFCHAATWPDIARGLPTTERNKFHRPRWHYINLPVFLGDEQAAAFAGDLPANVEFELSGDWDELSYNGVQAVKHSLQVVSSAGATDEERAVHYCWLLHIVGDLHQPLHSAALFSLQLFPDGDQGGNRIKIRREGATGGGQKLHAVWDGFLGKQAAFTSVRTKASALVQEYSSEFNAPFVALPFDVWTTETQQLAAQAVYQPLVDQVAAAEDEADQLDVLDVPPSYFQDGGRIAARQAVIAGVRLAGILKTTLAARSRSEFMASAGLGFPAAFVARKGSGAHGRRLSAEGTVPAAADTIDQLQQRIRRLEATVYALRREQRTTSDDGRAFRPGAPRRGPALLRALEGDGEQCTCGEEEE